MRLFFSILLGKLVRTFSRLKGGGTALPGLIVERINPTFLTQVLENLPHGTVVISGTNGKTTTTKMVVELLESQGLKVFTNKSGSNFTRGVVSALLERISLDGSINADIAVIELDEAHAVHFVKQVAPSYCLLLNVLRDQLDRFGEIDHTAKLLQKIATKTTKGVVVNRDDPRLSAPAFIKSIKAPVTTYGISAALSHVFLSDEALRSHKKTTIGTFFADDTCLEAAKGEHATIAYAGTSHTVQLKELRGLHNVQNATAAIALTRAILGDKLQESALFDTLSTIQPSFGRGETLEIDGQPIELILVKNPSGFRLGLASYDHTKAATMIAINDNYADGRDMSWLWDVDFSPLGSHIAITSGSRSYDIALRLSYDDITVDAVDPILRTAIESFLQTNKHRPKRIFCTYTAMLTIRKLLKQYGEVKASL